MLLMISTASLIGLAPTRAIRALLRAWPLLLIGLLACLSMLWSAAPGVSLRYGVQLSITIVAAIVLMGALPPYKVVQSLFISSCFILLLCMLSGRQGPSESGFVLIGILGSKNEMGALCNLLICSGVTLIFSSQNSRAFRLAAVPAVLIATLVLLASFSAGAVVVTVMFIGLTIAFAIASRIPPATQFAFALILMALLAPIWLVRDDLLRYWEFFVVDVLNKDLGLTGRDYLWAHADRLIEQQPLLGYGYRSIWLGQDVETIGLLRWAGLSSGAGFNFHDTYREWAVDFGLAGAALICLIVFLGLFKAVLRALRRNVSHAEIFFAAMGITVMVRAKFETVLGPFSSSTVLLIAIVAIGYLAPQAASVTRTAARQFGAGRRRYGAARPDTLARRSDAKSR